VKFLPFCALVAGLFSLGLAMPASGALVPRLGGQAVYDTDLNITWIADANLAATNTFGIRTGINLPPHPLDTNGQFGRIASDGSMNYSGALYWIDAMNAYDGAGYLGFNDWRFPFTQQPDPSCSLQSDGVSNGLGCSGSDMGHLYNVEGVTSATPGVFSNVVPWLYWSYQYEPDPTYDAWSFQFEYGTQGTILKTNVQAFAWAVRDGDVVPIPASVWLFGTGLLGLIAFARFRLA